MLGATPGLALKDVCRRPEELSGLGSVQAQQHEMSRRVDGGAALRTFEEGRLAEEGARREVGQDDVLDRPVVLCTPPGVE